MLCRHGLFIGVERHAGLAKSDWLSAMADASALRDYFARSHPEGVWRLLPEARRRRPPKRIDVLAALKSFAEEIPPNTAGIIFFSGHASVTSNGLTLKTFDADERFLEDTGVRLARVFDLLRQYSVVGKKFFLILDCCRTGLPEASVDTIPPNVCALYACGRAEAAWDTGQGGVLTRSMIESLSAIASDTGRNRCTVSHLSGRLGRELFRWRTPQMFQHELCGSSTDSLLLPIASDRDTATIVASPPTSRLRYGFGTLDSFQQGLAALSRSIFDWYGLSYASPAGQALVREHLRLPKATSQEVTEHSHVTKQDNDSTFIEPPLLAFDVQVPAGCVRWSASEFLVHMVLVPSGAAETLIIGWPRRVDFAELKYLQHIVNGDWTKGGSDSEYRLIWMNSYEGAQYRGVGTLSIEPSTTRLYIACETADCFEMPLFNLMPRLPDIFDLIRSVSS